jgi:CTP:molybdopterin cytidylyltransferase MocA
MAAMIPAIVLAAGRSSRMGVPKATLAFDARDTFLSHLVRTFHAAGVDDVIVVLGHDGDAIARSLEQGDVAARIVMNREYDRGQLSSLQAALILVDRPGVEAMLVTLVDVPFLTPPTVHAVLDRYRLTRAAIVRPTSGNRHGHPLLMARSVFDAVRRADDRTGVKPVVRAHASVEGDVPVGDEGAFVDVDTPGDYEKLFRRPISDRVR